MTTRETFSYGTFSAATAARERERETIADLVEVSRLRRLSPAARQRLRGLHAAFPEDVEERLGALLDAAEGVSSVGGEAQRAIEAMPSAVAEAERVLMGLLVRRALSAMLREAQCEAHSGVNHDEFMGKKEKQV